MRGRAVVVIAILGVLMVGCGGGSSDEQGVNGSPQPPFKVALAMSYVGNDWQIEAKNLVNAEARTPPYDRLIKLDNYVAGAAGAGGADVERQIEQMQQMIAKGYDAIIAFPISPTALNPVVKQACERGVVVIAYDAELTEPCAYNVHINQVAAGKFTAAWLAKQLHGKGNIVEANGVPGTSVDTQRRQGAASVWKKNPGIKVVAQFPGLWDQASTQQGMARILGARKDINGVWAQVGFGALQAYKAAKRPLVPMVGESENGFRAAMADGTVKGISYGSPPYTGAYALKEAVAILEGHRMPRLMQVPLPLNTKDQLKKCTDVAKGCNVFPPAKAPSTGFFADFYDRDLVPELCLAAATSAKPCPGRKAKPPVDKSFPANATSRG